MLVILYADDTVLFAADSAVEMQIQLDNFSEYCSLWKLNVNSKISSSFSISSVIQFSSKEFLICKKSSKSFKYKENKKGNNFSPCLTPALHYTA
jgi:spore coat protein CotH